MLSLSEHRIFPGAAVHTLKTKEQCLDKLSMNGFGGTAQISRTLLQPRLQVSHRPIGIAAFAVGLSNFFRERRE